MPADRRRQGFTLVEMSVVLVIIGLLAGGIVAGQSYIKKAQLSSLMTETKYYMNAFAQFQQQYHAVPGDMATADQLWPDVVDGDGNGLIRAGNTTGGDPPPNPGEIYYVFQHLAHAG